MKFVIHKNKAIWGTVWHIITNDGVGHICVSIENDVEGTIFLSGLSVVSNARNKGIGKKLISEAEKIGIENNKERCRLDVEKTKTWLYDFYTKLGYELWDEDSEYYCLVKYLKE